MPIHKNSANQYKWKRFLSCLLDEICNQLAEVLILVEIFAPSIVSSRQLKRAQTRIQNKINTLLIYTYILQYHCKLFNNKKYAIIIIMYTTKLINFENSQLVLKPQPVS